MHGKNQTYNSDKCSTLKNKAKNKAKLAKKTFTNKGLHKEINILAHASTMEKVLDLYTTVIAIEKAKLKKKKSKKTKKQEVMDTDFNSNNSIAVIKKWSYF